MGYLEMEFISSLYMGPMRFSYIYTCIEISEMKEFHIFVLIQFVEIEICQNMTGFSMILVTF